MIDKEGFSKEGYRRLPRKMKKRLGKKGLLRRLEEKGDPIPGISIALKKGKDEKAIIIEEEGFSKD